MNTENLDKQRFVDDQAYRLYVLFTGNFRLILTDVPVKALVQLVRESFDKVRRLCLESNAPMKSLRDILPLSPEERTTISSPVVPLDLDTACAYFCFSPTDPNPSIPAPWHEELEMYKGLYIVITFGNVYMWLPAKNEPILLTDRHLQEMFEKDPSIAMYCLHAIKEHLGKQAAHHVQQAGRFSAANESVLAIINRIGWGS